MKQNDFKPGDVVEFIDSTNPLIIKKLTIIGPDKGSDDRILGRYEYHDGIFHEIASIHINRILPKKS